MKNSKKLKYSLFLYLFCLLGLQKIYSQVDAVEQNETKIKVDIQQIITLDQTTVSIDSLAFKINAKLKDYKKEDLAIHTANIEVSSNTKDEFIELIKAKIQNTPIQFTNVQRSVVANFSESGPVTDEMILQYNTLIEGWNNEVEEDRYFRKIELNYVENIHQRMTFKQQVKAKKLPGYLYFVKTPEMQTDISKQKMESWRFSDEYRVYINDMQIEKGILSAKSPESFTGYYILKYLINEEPINEVHLFTK